MLRRDPEVVTVLHFDLAAAPAVFGEATLEVPLLCLDPDAPDGAVAVYVFPGDGETSVDERAVGESLGTFGCEPGAYPVLRLTVTDRVRSYLDAGHPFLSIRLRSAVGEERYDVGSAGGLEPPVVRFWE